MTPNLKVHHVPKMTKEMSFKESKRDRQEKEKDELGELQRGITGESAIADLDIQVNRIGVYQRMLGGKKSGKNKITPWVLNVNQE